MGLNMSSVTSYFATVMLIPQRIKTYFTRLTIGREGEVWFSKSKFTALMYIQHITIILEFLLLAES